MKKCAESSGMVILKGQHSCLLPLKKGKSIVFLKVMSGKLQLNHGCYTPDGGTWLTSPSGNRKSHYLLQEGNEYVIEIDIQESFGKLDKVDIVNVKLFMISTFQYSINFIDK